MQKLLVPLRTLQPLLTNEDKFTDSDNQDKIHEQLIALRRDFHSLERIPTKYRSQPGFEESVKHAAQLLDDASRRFDEGRKEYAWWRLQGLPMDCFSCHATYKVSSEYSNTAMVDESLNPLERARFLMATRQFTEAKKTLLSALDDDAYRLYDDQILRSLLLIETRVSKDPKESLEMFRGILKSGKLPLDDAHTVQLWLKGMEAWSKAPAVREANKLTTGERLIRAGATRGIDFTQDDVALLRGTALVHETLETGNLNESQRRKAIYLLGYAYSQLPQFFTEGWDELYLEKCIKEFPNTQEAKWAYNIYSDKVMNDFTGSGGINIPAEIKLHLEELRKTAYGEKEFAPKA
jgi:hypothetical protein